MPTYEYRCPEGHQFELVQKMSDRPRAKCPRCGRMAERERSPQGFRVGNPEARNRLDRTRKGNTRAQARGRKNRERKAREEKGQAE